VESVGKGEGFPLKVIPLRSRETDLLLLPNVWSKPERYGPSTTFCPSDPKLKVIQDLGTVGQSKAMTVGIIAAMKALEIAVVVNNASTEGQVMTDVLEKERDAILAKVTEMEKAALAAKKESDRWVEELEKQVVEAQKALELECEVKAKFAKENQSLEEFHDAYRPKKDESEDTTILSRAGLLEKIGVLEANLMDRVKHGFDNAIAQLKVVNPSVELCVDGTDFLKWVEDELIMSPTEDMDEDAREDGMWITPRPKRSCNILLSFLNNPPFFS